MEIQVFKFMIFVTQENSMGKLLSKGLKLPELC